MEREILLLGDPRLYEVSEEVTREELEELRPVFTDLFDCISRIQRDYGFGRAIAAPQIGVQKRLICMLTDKPYVFINPTLEFVGDEMMEVMDDCMSFPNLLVRVQRYRHCLLRYKDENWEDREMRMDDDMSELIQHEYDHLDGILSTMRAIDEKAFAIRENKPRILPEIANRRSIRSYSDKEVTDEQVDCLIEAARLAPSGSNKQPWDFIVVRSYQMREKISSIDHNQKWMLTAPVFIVCIGNEKYRGDGDMERVIRDSAIATEHILLQAEHMGLGACWTGWFDQNEMRSALGLDERCYVIGVVTIGYPDGQPVETGRRSLEYREL